MNYELLKAVVLGKQRGSFRSLEWQSKLPLRKEYAGHEVIKRTKGVVRFGIEYGHMQSVKDRRESVESSGTGELKWGKFILYPFFISHNDNVYLRVYRAFNTKFKVQYFLDGQQVKREDIEGMCLKSAFRNTDRPLDTFTVNIENVINVG